MNVVAPIGADERVEAAGRLVANGRLAEAETLVRTVLEQEPRHADALNTLASIALARRDGQRAFEILGPACTAYPTHARLLANLGVAYLLLDQAEGAAACLERAVALSPSDAEIRLSLAQCIIATGDVERARYEVDAVLTDDPQNVSALMRLGLIHIARSEPNDAEAALRRAVALDPKNADVNHNLSVLCGMTSRFEEAALFAERALLWAPHDIAKRIQHARCQAGVGNFEEANAHCKQVLVFAPENFPATELFAQLTLTRGAVPAGLETLSHYVRKHPKNPDAILALAGALRSVGRMQQALTFVEQALLLAPDHAFGQSMRGNLLMTLGRFSEVSRDASFAGVTLPNYAVAPKGTSPMDALVFGRLLSSLDGSEVLLTSFADGTATDLLAHIRNTRLVEPCETEALLLQQLPAALQINRNDLPHSGRFIDPDPAHLERWREALAAFPRPLIGIDWDQFAPGLRIDALVALLDGRGTLVSLAADPERHQLANWPKIIDAGRHIRDAADLIAVSSCLDAVVATDGLPLHVAGALAIPGIAFTPCGYPWYFADKTDRSQWYPSLLLARQTSPANWDAPLSKANEFLTNVLNIRPRNVVIQ